jgi:hypothetical protein
VVVQLKPISRIIQLFLILVGVFELLDNQKRSKRYRSKGEVKGGGQLNEIRVPRTFRFEVSVVESGTRQ